MDAKVIAAGLAALVGVGVAGWVISGQLGGGNSAQSASAASRGTPTGDDAPNAPEGEPGDIDIDVPAGGERVVLGPGGAEMQMPAWMEPARAPEAGWSFERVADAEAAGEALDVGSGVLEEIVTRDKDLGALGGASKLSLVESWRRFTRPLVADDPVAFANAVTTLGGVASAAADGTLLEGPAAGLYDRLTGFLAGAVIDWAASTTRRADPADRMDVPSVPSMPGVETGDGIPTMVMVLANEENGVRTERRAVSIPLQNLFADAAGASEAGAPTVEIWVPASLRSGDRQSADAGIATFMTWNADRRTWAPIAMRITLETQAATDAFERASASARNGG